MATENATSEQDHVRGLIAQEAFQKLRELIDLVRSYRAQRSAYADEQTRRGVFVGFEVSAGVARGYLECLVTLDLLTEAEEAQWYEYLSGERLEVPQ